MLSRNCNQKHVGVGRMINMINGSVSVITIWTCPFGKTRAEGRSGERRGWPGWESGGTGRRTVGSEGRVGEPGGGERLEAEAN